MNIKHIFAPLLVALVLVVGVAQIAGAQSTDPTNAELNQMISDLTDRVTMLEDDLADATSTIATLTSQVDDLESTISDLEDQIDGLENATSSSNGTDTSNDDDDDSDEDDTVTGDVSDNGTGTIVLCHKGKNTIRVGIAALRAHLAHGDSTGMCGASGNMSDDTDDDTDDTTGTSTDNGA